MHPHAWHNTEISHGNQRGGYLWGDRRPDGRLLWSHVRHRLSLASTVGHRGVATARRPATLRRTMNLARAGRAAHRPVLHHASHDTLPRPPATSATTLTWSADQTRSSPRTRLT